MNTFHTPPTAQNDTVDFAPLAGARHLLLTTTSKAVTPFAGLASFIAWLRQIGFLDQVPRALPFSYASPNAIPITHKFTAFLLSVVVGASRFAHCDWLRADAALHAMLGFKRFPGDDAILRFFARLLDLTRLIRHQSNANRAVRVKAVTISESIRPQIREIQTWI